MVGLPAEKNDKIILVQFLNDKRLLKRQIRGTHRGVSEKHHQRYVNKRVEKMNRRLMLTFVKMILIWRRVDDKVLRYQDLTA